MAKMRPRQEESPELGEHHKLLGEGEVYLPWPWILLGLCLVVDAAVIFYMIEWSMHAIRAQEQGMDEGSYNFMGAFSRLFTTLVVSIALIVPQAMIGLWYLSRR